MVKCVCNRNIIAPTINRGTDKHWQAIRETNTTENKSICNIHNIHTEKEIS